MYYDSLNDRDEPYELFIRTLEGDHHVSVDDYVIKGKLYPCKFNIFEETYKEILPMKELAEDIMKTL